MFVSYRLSNSRLLKWIRQLPKRKISSSIFKSDTKLSSFFNKKIGRNRKKLIVLSDLSAVNNSLLSRLPSNIRLRINAYSNMFIKERDDIYIAKGFLNKHFEKLLEKKSIEEEFDIFDEDSDSK